MRRRTFLVGLGATALTRPAFAGYSKLTWKMDENGRLYRDEFRFGNFVLPDGTRATGATFRIYKTKVTSKPGGAKSRDMNTVVTDPKPQPGSISTDEVATPQEADGAAAKAKAGDPDMKVEDYGYSFGRAGMSAAGEAMAYSVASTLAGLPDQAERIAQMQQDLQVMRTSLSAQAAAAADRMAGLRDALEARGADIDAEVGDPVMLPTSAFSDVLRLSDQGYLFATPDAVLAGRLHRVVLAADKFDPARIPGPVFDLVKASVRQSDAESAIGNETSAEELYTFAGNLTEAALGFMPAIGAVQSAYELVTGHSLITGRTLSRAEMAFAAVNLVLLGEFGTVEHGLEAMAKVGRILGGARGVAMGKAVVEVLQHWPTKVINRVLAWRAAGQLVSAEERIGLAAGRSLVPAAAVDGIYARVMPRTYAEALQSGGKLAGGEVAFITEASEIGGLNSWAEISRKLTLFEESGALRSYAGEVVVEFKFVSDEPLAFLAKPFGEIGSNGPLWLPGGYTAGGAREWVIDADAIVKGLVDVKTLRIRAITP